MDILITARKMGLRKIVRTVLYRFFFPINTAIYKICLKFPINDKLIVMESEGDLSDNAYALYHYMKENGITDRYKVVWLVENKREARKREKAVFVTKNPIWIEIRRAYYLATCKWYIYDHGCVLPLDYHRKDQKVIYLCHGYAGFKMPKGNLKSRAKKMLDEVITTGDIPLKGVIDFFDMEEENVKTLGFSRLDWFYSDLNQVRAQLNTRYSFDSYDKVLLWMPTFRKSTSINISEDYLDTGTGLPLLISKEQFVEFNRFLKERNILCILKLHHLQAEMEIFQKKQSNILILRDRDFQNLGIQLYQFIPLTHALISDYSSISTDYMLLDKPMMFILDDYEEYNKSRGVYPENALELMPGDHIYTIEQLQDAIVRVSLGEDSYRSQRELLVPRFHCFQDGNSSKRILDYLGIL